MLARSLPLCLLVLLSCNGMRAGDSTPGERAAAPSAAPPIVTPARPAAPAASSRGAHDAAPTTPGDPSATRDPSAAGDPGAAADTTEAMAAAAQTFLAARPGDDRVRLAFDDRERESWHYVPRRRKGLMLGSMDADQRQAAHALLHSGLSQDGHDKVQGIIALEAILGRIEGNPGFRDPARYTLALFGDPAAAAPWGWRFEGHHLSLNFTLVDRQVATTPAFLGANPARVPSGPRQGERVLADEEDQGRALMASLTAAQRERALIARTAPDDIVTRASRRARLAGFEGLPAADMSPAQRAALLRLIEVYTGRFRPELARAHMERIERAGVDRLHFAWAGSSTPGRPHYYRIHGPSHLIEYDNRGNHIHTVFRDLEGDFGENLLAEHLETHHHGRNDGGRGHDRAHGRPD